MTTTNRERGLAASLAAVLLLAQMAVDAPPARALVRMMTLDIDPAYAPAGGSPLVRGTGFAGIPWVAIGFAQNGEEEVLEPWVATDASGSFHITVTVPLDAELGDAEIFADIPAGLRTDAPFFVTDSEPIGDTPAPPAGKRKDCEVVVILDKLTNRLEFPAGQATDRLNVQIHSSAPLVKAGTSDRHNVTDDFVRGQSEKVARIVGRFIKPKGAFPLLVAIEADIVANVASPHLRDASHGRAHAVKQVDCPSKDPVVVEVSVPLRRLAGDDPAGSRGFVDLVYRIIVREVRDT